MVGIVTTRFAGVKRPSARRDIALGPLRAGAFAKTFERSV
jgi:hypothetical protein